MGAWGYGIFDDDLALDIKGDFEDYIEDGLTVEEATERILEDYEEIIAEDDDESPAVYLAVASLQMEQGKLQEEIKKKAIEIIESGQDLERWEDNALERKKVLSELKEKLLKA